MVDRSVELCDGKRIAMVFFGIAAANSAAIVRVPMPETPVEYATRLYAVLHDLDQLGLDRILIELPPATDEWLAGTRPVAA